MSRCIVRLFGACLVLFLIAEAPAQSNKPLRLIVPFPAGGTADILPRVVADKMHAQFPAGIVVENRSGAGGNIGADDAYRAEPDGSVLLASPPGPVAINQHLYRKLSFDPTRWVPITVLATVPNVLAVSAKLPARNLAEFIAYLKANPGKVSYASQGNGSTSHLTAGMFMQITGTAMTHIPYKGTAPALVDLAGGHVDVFFDNLASSAPLHQSGKLRILAVADDHRATLLPDVPTFNESGVPMTAVTFFSIVAPPATSPATVATLYQSINLALSLPEVKQRFAEQGVEPRGWSPDVSSRFIRAESEKWGKIIKAANITLD
jgi:tripartite-type tricarboxylate transporter receptor subunit TctC